MDVSAAYVFKLVGAYKTPKEKKEPRGRRQLERN